MTTDIRYLRRPRRLSLPDTSADAPLLTAAQAGPRTPARNARDRDDLADKQARRIAALSRRTHAAEADSAYVRAILRGVMTAVRRLPGPAPTNVRLVAFKAALDHLSATDPRLKAARAAQFAPELSERTAWLLLDDVVNGPLLLQRIAGDADLFSQLNAAQDDPVAQSALLGQLLAEQREKGPRS